MNSERIRELAEEAKAYARQQFSHAMDSRLFSAQVFEKKFAELVWAEAYEQGYSQGVSDSVDGQGV